MFEQEGEGVRTFEDGMARDGRRGGGWQGRDLCHRTPSWPGCLLMIAWSDEHTAPHHPLVITFIIFLFIIIIFILIVRIQSWVPIIS